MPYCEQQVTREQVQQFVRDVADTKVDAVLCCPTMLRRVLWRSEIDPHWQKEVPLLADRDDEDPILARGDQSMYYRMHRYIMNDGDPVRDTFEAAKEAGMDFFISYRMNDWHYFELFYRLPEYRLEAGGHRPLPYDESDQNDDGHLRRYIVRTVYKRGGACRKRRPLRRHYNGSAI